MKFDLGKFQNEVKKKLGGKTIREAAKEVGMPHPTLWKCINGQEPRLGSILKILEWLGKDFYYFVHK